jgi:hypothetical protein
LAAADESLRTPARVADSARMSTISSALQLLIVAPVLAAA